MSRKPSRNAPCPCGSGAKFKRCHGAASHSLPDNPGPLVQGRRAFLRASSCLATGRFGVARCKRPVRAHSITRSRDLSAIAEQGHVLSLADRKRVRESGLHSVDLRAQAFAPPERMGIRAASVFLGLCADHDNLLFRCIEDEAIVPTREQRVAMMLRPALFELHRKQEELAGLKSIADPLRGFLFQGTPSFEPGRMGDTAKRALTISSLENLSTSALDALEDQSDWSVRHLVARTGVAPVFHFASAMTPAVDLYDRQLQDLQEPTGPPELAIATSWTDSSGFCFMISAATKSTAGCCLIDQALELPVDEALHRLLRLVFNSTENIMLAPSWWHRIGDHIREFVMLSSSPFLPSRTRVREGPDLLDTGSASIQAVQDAS